MKTATRRFLKFLDEKNCNYCIVNESDDHTQDEDLVCIPEFCGNNFRNIDIAMMIDNNNIAFSILSLAHVSEYKKDLLLNKLNELNNKYRWVSFYINNDNDVEARIDAFYDTLKCEEICYHALARLVSIADESFPAIMHEIW